MAFCTLVLCVTAVVSAEEPAHVIRIEEDWELKVRDPDPDNSGPQMINVVSPNGSITGDHFVFELNHQTCHQYYPGGMQLQNWIGEKCVGHQMSSPTGSLHHADELISYTIVMDLHLEHQHLKVSVTNGKSTTWGDFGGINVIKVYQGTTATDLDAYDWSTSLKYSRVGYGRNRVTSFVLKEIRFYSEDGTLLGTEYPANVDNPVPVSGS
jgi:hypothetical protein